MVAARKLTALVLKDLRHVWVHALIVLPLLYLFSTHDLEPLTRHQTALKATFWQLLFLATPLAIWSLVATTIQSEPLVGDRQYWLTRPFRWHQLALAKLLVVVLCINAPLFLFQAWALAFNNISPVTYLPDLLCRQIFFSALVLLPGAALAAVTGQQGQFALFLLVAVAPFAGLAWITWNGDAMPETRWMATTAVAAVTLLGSGVILVLQYARRRTFMARLMLAATALAGFGCLFVPWESVLRPPPAGPGIRLALNMGRAGYESPDRKRLKRSPVYRNVAIELPLAAEGLPRELELALDRYRIRMESPELPGIHPVIDFVRLHGWNQGEGFLTMVLSANEFRALREHDVTVKGWLDVTLLRRGQVLNTKPDVLHIARFGICARDREVCLSPAPHALLSLIRTPEEDRPDQYGRIVPAADAEPPFPASPWLYPLEAYHYEPTAGALLVERPSGQFRLDFDFQKLDLNGLARPY